MPSGIDPSYCTTSPVPKRSRLMPAAAASTASSGTLSAGASRRSAAATASGVDHVAAPPSRCRPARRLAYQSQRENVAVASSASAGVRMAIVVVYVRGPVIAARTCGSMPITGTSRPTRWSTRSTASGGSPTANVDEMITWWSPAGWLRLVNVALGERGVRARRRWGARQVAGATPAAPRPVPPRSMRRRCPATARRSRCSRQPSLPTIGCPPLPRLPPIGPPVRRADRASGPPLDRPDTVATGAGSRVGTSTWGCACPIHLERCWSPGPADWSVWPPSSGSSPTATT